MAYKPRNMELLVTKMILSEVCDNLPYFNEIYYGSNIPLKCKGFLIFSKVIIIIFLDQKPKK
jgi:hypothetical protein